MSKASGSSLAISAAALFLTGGSPAGAHHSMAAMYGAGQVAIDGVVARYEWTNPHVWIFVDAGDPPRRFEVEFPSRIELARTGWSADSLRPGDRVSVTGYNTREPSRRVRGVTVTLPGNRRLTAEQAAPPASREPARPTPRWPDGHPRLGPVPGEKGYWANPSGGLYETAAGAITMDAEGLLADIGDAAKVAPFLPWAHGLYVYRQRNFLADDPMAACLPPGGPRQFQVPYGVRFLEEPSRQRLFVLSQGGNRNWRLIALDGRATPDPEEVTPSYFGYSSGRWEGDTLVIESSGYVERFWFSNGGLPHTESLRLTERISRPDYSTLRYEVTVDDPGAYSRPWSGGWTLKWIPQDEEDEYFCDDYNRELDHVN